MRLNKLTIYAVKVLVECARAGDQLVKVASIAERNGLTHQHGLKVAHLLMRNGFLVNQRGPHGGIRLARPAAEIKIGDVVRALESTSSSQDTPAMEELIDGAFAAFVEVLDQHTIADLAGKSSRTSPQRADKKKRSRTVHRRGRKHQQASAKTARDGRVASS
jgi:Rrf2 family nitric oxide-sensitive transcriptional repressor